MCDTKAIVRASKELQSAGEPFLIATVVRVLGSSYRKPGARMLLTEDRWIAGSVSGGCLEGDLVRRGAWCLKDHKPTVLRYDSTEPDELGWALGCRGVVDVLLEPSQHGQLTDPLGVMARSIQRQKPSVIATVFDAQPSAGRPAPVGARVVLEGRRVSASPSLPDELLLPLASAAEQALRAGTSGTCQLSVGPNLPMVDALVEVVEPPIRLFILGAGHDAAPLVELASTLGWEVIVWAPHPRVSVRQRFARADALVTGDLSELRELIDASDRAACVTMNHHLEQDRRCLEMLLDSKASYIGALGPRHRTETLLASAPTPRPWDARLQSPVGLPIGAETPAEIALAIVAQVQATFGTPSRAKSASGYASESALSSYPLREEEPRASHSA